MASSKESMKILRDKRREIGLCECGAEIKDKYKKCEKCRNRLKLLGMKRRSENRVYVRIYPDSVIKNRALFNALIELKMGTKELSELTRISQRQLDRYIFEGSTPILENRFKINSTLNREIFDVT
jgi:hypothetical protein